VLDSDGDGIDDVNDPDANNDGIPDASLGDGDSDGDGVPDNQDADIDGDGIPNVAEGLGNPDTDTDGDGIPNFLDTDSDGDGIDDSVESTTDADGDGIANFLDTDSDGDGIDDSIEVGDNTSSPLDSDGDGTADFLDVDADGDSLPDVLEGNVDTDGDGIANHLDLDSDNDGLSDASEGSADTDGDGSPDAQDVDSDGDGESDTVEGIGDTDGDGIPDGVDTDSDNDGVADLVEGIADTDGDGVIDALDTDSDNDGIPDAIEVGTDGANPIDSDNDGIPDFQDLDSDNDGLTDAFESGGIDENGDGVIDNFVDSNGDGVDDGVAIAPLSVDDTDKDGTADYRDLDSDNDGLSDLLETSGSSADTDYDGRVDGFVDDNGDGLDDSVALAPATDIDVDGDGQANHLDLDTDNDGVFDLVEAGGDDADGDGIINSMADRDQDGIPDSVDSDATGGEDSDNDGIDDSADVDFVSEDDSDGDGIIDSRDPDSNGDGFALLLSIDGTEVALGATLPDSNGDGIPDIAQANAIGQWHTGVAGSGCSIATHNGASRQLDPTLTFLMLLALLSFICRYKQREQAVHRRVALATLLLAITGCSTIERNAADDSPTLKRASAHSAVNTIPATEQRPALRRHIYAGIGLGVSQLEPVPQDFADASVDDSQGVGGQITLGVDVNKWASLELHSADLGSAGLSTGGRIHYHMTGVSALMYVGKNRHHNRRQGLTGFGRLGYGMIDNSSEGGVSMVQDNGTFPLLGAGLEYMTRFGLGLRAEYIAFTPDAGYGQLGLIYRTGRRSPRPAPVIAQQPAPAPVIAPVIAPVPAVVVAKPLDGDLDGVLDSVDKCPTTEAGAAVNTLGCALLAGVIDGVNFHTDSAELTADARLRLNEVVKTLQLYPTLSFELSAHTDNVGSTESNQLLSKKRAISVGKHLRAAGVALNRFRIKAYGETRPIADNQTAQGRQVNRRVELTVLKQ